MSAALYVLKCDEFAPLLTQLPSGATIEEWGSYLRLSADEVLRFERAVTGVNEAIWYAAATGGIEGHITRYDADVLEIVSDLDD